MSKKIRQRQRKDATKHILMQALFLLLLSISVCFLSNMNGYMAVSWFAGGLISILANCLFALRVFTKDGFASRYKIVRNFYRGEALKILFSVILLTLLFRDMPLAPLAVLFGYITQVLSPFFVYFLGLGAQKLRLAQ